MLRCSQLRWFLKHFVTLGTVSTSSNFSSHFGVSGSADYSYFAGSFSWQSNCVKLNLDSTVVQAKGQG